MAGIKITEHAASDSIKDDTYVLVTQTEEENGRDIHALRRIPYNNFAAPLGVDLDFDEDSETLYLINRDGARIGQGTGITAGITGLRLYTETDETGTQYLIMEDSEGNELTRTEFSVQGGGGSTSYVNRLINGMAGTKLSYPSGQACVLNYEFYEYYGAEQTTASATAEIYTKTGTSDYIMRRSTVIQQGANQAVITDYLQPGTNYVKLQVTSGESQTVKVLVYTINVVDISLTSSFDATKVYSSAISFPYRVTGRNINKTMYFYIDGALYDTVEVGTSHNVQLNEVINLASYGHGDHMLECYFVTNDGARSPSLKYDIMYTTGAAKPIISSTFEETEVAYGELIQVQYAVYTEGSDYTDEVDLDIYTLDGSGDIVYYQQSALANVVNEQLQNWNITEYPSSGTIYLRISAGTATPKVFSMVVQENTGDRDISGVTNGLIASYSASGRSNSDANKTSMNAAYMTIDDVTTNIAGTLTGFNWRSNGWMSDRDGFPVLRVSGGAQATLELPFFSASWVDAAHHTINLAGTPTGSGRTFEITFRTAGVTDESDSVMTIWDGTAGIGVKVFPSRAYLLSSTMSTTEDADGNILNGNDIPFVRYSSQEGKVRLTFVIEEYGHYVETGDNNQQKQLIKIYVNGQLAKALAYSSDTFTTSAAKPILSAQSCVLDVYSMRFYDYGLTDADVLKNYIADQPSLAQRIVEYDRNDITNDSGQISLTEAAKQYVCMVLTGVLSQYKGNKVKIGCQLIKPDGTTEDGYYVDWDFMDTLEGQYGNVNNVQGTSSQYYIKKNYKITFYRLENGEFKKVKVAIFDDRIPVNTICIKADYMSPDSANTGNANYWQTLCPEQTPPQQADSRVQTAIMGYPILLFQRDDASREPSFIGRYNLNNDKGNIEAFGLETSTDSGNATKCQKWEFLDNSEPICNFLTDSLHALRTKPDGAYYEAWEDALESCYPDQGDLEDEGLRPNTRHIQILYSWLVQRADFLTASTESGTGGTYNGASYDTEYELKYAIFRREFSQHFNVAHTSWYFIANEVPLLVDNFAKNMFLTCYDVSAENIMDTNGSSVDINDYIVNGVVDVSSIDWERSTFAKWYPTLYDLDSCLGADNNGRDMFPYYSEMWDTYNSRQIVNGNPSKLWKLFYAAFYSEIQAMYRQFRDTDKTLSAGQYLTALIDDLTATLPVVAINADQKYKYIDAYEGGYYDSSANNGAGGWVYTPNFLYLAKSTMESYHRDFVTKRFAMLDSKYMSDAYKQDNFNFRINRAGNTQPADITFNVSPCQAMYLYTEWGNSGSYRGGKCMESESVAMAPAEAGNWSNIVVACYGASHIKSFGDLSPLYPDLLQSLNLCVNLQELILGSDAQGYTNAALTSVSDVQYLTMLRKINVCNCISLTGTLDLSNCDLIEEVYATGSGISAAALPQGGYLKKLFLPASVTALNVISHSGLTDFGMDSYANLTRLHVENTPNIPTDEILATRRTNLTRIRLVGVNWTLTSEAALEVLADASMGSKAIDANGNAVDSTSKWPTVTGTVNINRIRGSLLSTLNARYPNLTINYTTKYHIVRFYNENALWDTQTVDDGDSAEAPTTPTKAHTTQYFYSFSGWSGSYANVSSDMTLYAQYASSLQQYKIEFYDSADTATRTLLDTVNNVSYGTEYTFGGTWPTKAGNIFCGWQDGAGNTYEYARQMPNNSTAIDSNGVPQTIELYPVWSEIAFPSATKDFAALTPGERMFAAIAIQSCDGGGTYTVGNTSYDVVYYEDTATYAIYNTGRTISISVAIADTKQWTLYNGETLTQQVLDFNHDYSDSAETSKLGITYAMQNLLTDTRQMNPSYQHVFNFQIGGDDPIVSDNNAHTSVSDPLLTHTHTASAAEVSTGYVDIEALGQTYLAKIIVTHSNGNTVTWHLDGDGFYGGTDAATFTQAADGTAVANNWYKSDLTVDANNPFYKMGKIMQNISGVDIVNWQGSVGLYGWATTQQQMAVFTNDTVTLSDFGGLKIDTTGTDTLNTAAKNPFNGTGKSRVVYHKDWLYNTNCFTEVSEGSIISVPVTTGDTVTVVCWGQIRNWGGWDNSAMCAWANGDFFDQLPFGLRSTIVEAYKKSSIGARSYVIQGNTYKMWLLSNSEVGGYVSNHPYSDEGTKYPVFTDNNSRLKYLSDSTGAVSYWWERSPIVTLGYNFYLVNTTGYPNGSNGASYRLGVCLGFCSGEA